jgi:electron transport complex protein RnfB
VDAILGAPKRMHTVIEDECTGCGLCLPPCPVDCIVLLPAPAFPEASASRARFLRRQARLERAEDPRKRIHRPRDEDRLKRMLVAAALARARSGKTHGSTP